MKVCVLLTRGKHLHGRIISERGNVCPFSFDHCIVFLSSIYGIWLFLPYLQTFLWTNKTSLGPPLFIKISVLSQENERNVECMRVLEGIVLLVLSQFLWFSDDILELFWQCSIFDFLLYLSVFINQSSTGVCTWFKNSKMA